MQTDAYAKVLRMQMTAFMKDVDELANKSTNNCSRYCRQRLIKKNTLSELAL